MSILLGPAACGPSDLNVIVILDGTISKAGLTVKCLPACSKTPFCGLCGDASPVERRTMNAQFVERLFPDGALEGWQLLLEFEPGTTRARVCREWFSDERETRFRDPVCATTGELRLSSDPSAATYRTVAAHLTASFDDGLRVEASF